MQGFPLIRACPNMASPCFNTFGLFFGTMVFGWFVALCRLQEHLIWVSKCGCKKLKDTNAIPAPDVLVRAADGKGMGFHHG